MRALTSIAVEGFGAARCAQPAVTRIIAPQIARPIPDPLVTTFDALCALWREGGQRSERPQVRGTIGLFRSELKSLASGVRNGLQDRAAALDDDLELDVLRLVFLQQLR